MSLEQSCQAIGFNFRNLPAGATAISSNGDGTVTITVDGQNIKYNTDGSLFTASAQSYGAAVDDERSVFTGNARGTPGSCHHSHSPPDVSVRSRETCLPCTDSTFSRGSTHTTVARGTALWESLVGKPRGKATDSLIHVNGSVTLLEQLGRKAHVHAPTRDED